MILKLIEIIGALYVAQVGFIVVFFYLGAFKIKRTLFINLIPFYWMKYLCEAIYDETMDKWNGLDKPPYSDDGY